MTTKELYRSIGVSGYEHQQCWRKDGGNIKGRISRGEYQGVSSIKGTHKFVIWIREIPANFEESRVTNSLQ